MRVILLKDIPKIGHKNDIKNVTDGYAQNFLIPHKFAKVATKSSEADLIKQKKKDKNLLKASEDKLITELDKLEKSNIEIEVKSNEKGHLFAGIHKEELIEDIRKITGIQLDAETIEIKEPIKEIGEHEISIRAGAKKFKIKINLTNI